MLAAAAPSDRAVAEPVDVELVLAADVSMWMSAAELAIQRDGYAAALTHVDVLRAIEDGAHGRTAIAYVEWAGEDMQRIVVPWTIVANVQDARAAAARLGLSPPTSARRTSISGMLYFAGDLFAESPHRGTRRVVDVSGDGPNNQGRPVLEAREALLVQGITINGLPLMTADTGFVSRFDLPDLDVYYRDCVVGGPGSFMIPVNDWSQFPEAVRRKLVLELAGDVMPAENAMPVIYAEFGGGDGKDRNSRSAVAGGVDCLVGEEMWLDRSWMWDGTR